MTASDIDHIINHLSLKKSRRRWRWIAIILGLGALVALIANAAGDGGLSKDHIARLRIDGLITGDQQSLDLLRDVASAPETALPFGRYHVGAGPVVTWRDFAERIVTRAGALGQIGRIPTVTGIPTSAYPTPARRPRNSVLAADASLTALAVGAGDGPRAGRSACQQASGRPSPVRVSSSHFRQTAFR